MFLAIGSFAWGWEVNSFFPEIRNPKSKILGDRFRNLSLLPEFIIPGRSVIAPPRSVLFIERLGDGASNGFMDISLTGEADLVFGGMDIDIHRIRGHIDENDGHRKLPLTNLWV